MPYAIKPYFEKELERLQKKSSIASGHPEWYWWHPEWYRWQSEKQRMYVSVGNIKGQSMEHTLQGIPGVEVMLDGIVVTGKSDDEYLENLEAVLRRLTEKDLRTNAKKYRFFVERIEYCGHEIDHDDPHKTKANTEAVQKAPRPQYVSRLRRFLGLVNYNHRFLPNSCYRRIRSGCGPMSVNRRLMKRRV